MSGAGPVEPVVSHLLVADDVLTSVPQSSRFVAVCGAEVEQVSGAGEDPGYCLECVRAALRWRAPRSRGEQRPEPGLSESGGPA